MKLPLPAWLQALRARLAARPDTEHEQALVRIAVGVVLFFYLLPAALRGGGASGTDLVYLAVMFGYLTFSLVVFALTITASLAGKNMTKGLIAGVFGLLVASMAQEQLIPGNDR